MLTVSRADLIGTLVLRDQPLKSISHDICSWPSGRLRRAFSIRYTKCRIWFSNDVVFCKKKSRYWALTTISAAIAKSLDAEFTLTKYLLSWLHYKNSSSFSVVKTCSIKFSSLTFKCYFRLKVRQTEWLVKSQHKTPSLLFTSSFHKHQA